MNDYWDDLTEGLQIEKFHQYHDQSNIVSHNEIESTHENPKNDYAQFFQEMNPSVMTSVSWTFSWNWDLILPTCAERSRW